MTTKINKRLILTTETNGHAHVISTGDEMHGTTSYVDGHTHDWVRDDTGTVLIAPTGGHQHGIKHIMTKADELEEAKDDEGKKPSKKPKKKDDDEGESKPFGKNGEERMTKTFEVKVSKVDTDLGLVFGYAVICNKVNKETEALERHFDLQLEHVPDPVMLDFSTDFMRNSRVAKAMHDGEAIGDVVFGFPMTAEVAKSLNITVEQTGFIIGMAPGEEGLAKFEDGTFTGFSIGGYAVYKDEE